MDKYELKDKLVHIYEEIGKLTCTLVENGCIDEETAEIRSRVLSAIDDAQGVIRNEVHQIF